MLHWSINALYWRNENSDNNNNIGINSWNFLARISLPFVAAALFNGLIVRFYHTFMFFSTFGAI